ncbi:transcriptional regulator, CarD family [Clostridium sp. DSM 8431]|uniref:CarD family transcriptional regulator n=1 Tax=Clostridium sp. DSM 8431 TaxID=1761781 RepID=UPI0008E83195|nr:CarD family transcriptional regulator [Clostridium sp. DSM 8431]SFU83580.1 transcriptional regulator, CarD family [Clostridium sp. DSM 8431]
MFKKGDVIVYPNQGIGVIDLIESREFKGDIKTFYNIHLLNNSLKLMMPESKIENSNIRLISDLNSLNSSLEKFKNLKPNANKLDNTNCKERLEHNSSKIKSGTFEDFLEVYSDLLYVRRQHSLNSSENQMFNKTKKILIEEISQVKGISRKDAENMLLSSKSN